MKSIPSFRHKSFALQNHSPVCFLQLGQIKETSLREVLKELEVRRELVVLLEALVQKQEVLVVVELVVELVLVLGLDAEVVVLVVETCMLSDL